MTDEGTGFGLRLLCAEGILPPGTAQDEHFVLIFAFPRTSFTGVTPWTRQNISGAQNLSGWSKFPPGHWALALQKLPLLRFHNCAWIAEPTLLVQILAGGPRASPTQTWKAFLYPRRGGACPSRRPLARSVISCRGGTPGPPGVSPPGFQPAV